tara:strand:+ start:181 stop:585 length:405 start_codon:yes stop_codon:yes gene_type:complete
VSRINITGVLLIMNEPINVFSEKLEICGMDPVTGFYRDGRCNTCKEDNGSHTVCIEVSQEFLDYTKSQGNDLSTPMPAYGFEGLEPGDSWCVCAGRWLEAERRGRAPRLNLQSTHIRALEIIPMELLKKYAIDD